MQSALRTAPSSYRDDIDWRRPRVRNLTVKRKEYDEPTAPGFDVSWNAPNMDTDTNRGFENLTLDDIEQYNYRYGKKNKGFSVEGALTKEGFSTVMSGLEPGAEYRVDVRVKYSNLRYSEWETAKYYRANRPPRLAAGRLNPTYILEWGGTDRVQRIDDDFTDPRGDPLTYSVSSSPAGIVTATIEDGDEENGNAIKNLRIHLLNPITGAANVTYGAHDAFGGYAFQVISVGGISYMTREVAENSPAGTAVGAPVAGTPYGNETLFYTLTGEAADLRPVRHRLGHRPDQRG